MSEEPVHLAKGANVALRQLGAELGSITVLLETQGIDHRVVDADVSVLLLAADGRVRSGDDLVFYNQPVGLGGAVHLREKIRPDDEAERMICSDLVTLELDDVPEEIERIVISASLDVNTEVTFGDAASISLRLQRTADAHDILSFEISDASSETALLFGEFYRRNDEWRFRAVGQGYGGGLTALVADHGVEVVADDDLQAGKVQASAAGETSQVAAPPVLDGANEERPGISLAEQSTASLSADREEVQLISRVVKVRRATRAPKLPADWDASIPAGDGNDWQPSRLFPVAGIGAGEEQERRATSALLAVMSMVREFGRVLTARCGAPGGSLETFIEVPFGQDEEAYRPDGVLRVSRGQKRWTALVEVKTGDGRLNAEQIDHYVDIARARSFDAVVTISNELTGAYLDHPVVIDRRKLRKIAFVHLSWDQIRTEAILLARHRGVADPTQRQVLEEFIRYMTHARSGMTGLTDMGPSWVRVRDAVKAKTIRSNDKAISEVSARFDQLVQHVGLQLSTLLGVEVQALAPRKASDNATRCQQLADSGMLFGSLRVPGAVDVIVLHADIKADKVGASITVSAPRGETRQSTRISWLLRQLPATAQEAIRVEALLAGTRGASTVAPLGKLRVNPESLISPDQREIRAFTLSLDLPMGAKRAAGSGTLINSVRTVTTTFYCDVVQHLRPWASRT